MFPKISKITELKENTSIATLFDNLEELSLSFLSNDEKKYLKKKARKRNGMLHF